MKQTSTAHSTTNDQPRNVNARPPQAIQPTPCVPSLIPTIQNYSNTLPLSFLNNNPIMMQPSHLNQYPYSNAATIRPTPQMSMIIQPPMIQQQPYIQQSMMMQQPTMIQPTMMQQYNNMLTNPALAMTPGSIPAFSGLNVNQYGQQCGQPWLFANQQRNYVFPSQCYPGNGAQVIQQCSMNDVKATQPPVNHSQSMYNS